MILFVIGYYLQIKKCDRGAELKSKLFLLGIGNKRKEVLPRDKGPNPGTLVAGPSENIRRTVVLEIKRRAVVVFKFHYLF